MAYRFEISKDAERDLDGIGFTAAQRIVEKLKWFSLQGNPFRFAEHLTDPAIGDLRFRIGDYRAVAIVDHRTHPVLIISIGHRHDIYRRR